MSDAWRIVEDDLSDPKVHALLNTHLSAMYAALLAHLLDVARRRGYTRVSLETGPEESFGPARRLYTRFGFVPCEAYGSYPADDPFSSFFTLEL